MSRPTLADRVEWVQSVTQVGAKCHAFFYQLIWNYLILNIKTNFFNYGSYDGCYNSYCYVTVAVQNSTEFATKYNGSKEPFP